MAEIHFDGLGELGMSLAEIAELPDEICYAMLDAEAEIIIAAQKQRLTELGLVKTGMLRDSIQAFHKRRGQEKFVSIYPYGPHSAYRRKKKTKVYKNSRHGRTYTVGGDTKELRNNELGFLLEYGSQDGTRKGYQWMRLANGTAVDAAIDAAKIVYDRFLRSKNL